MGLLKVEFEGVPRMLHAISELPKRVHNKVKRTAIRKAMRPMKTDLRQSAPKDKGNLKESIKVKLKTYRRAGPVGIVGAEVPQGAHAFFTEQGTDDRFTKTGKYTGKIVATHWAENSLRSTIPAATVILEQAVADGIEREAAALGGGS